MSCRILKTMKLLLLTMLAVGVLAIPSFALQTVYLISKTVDMTMPGGEVVPMWGFAQTNNACWSITSGGANSAASKAARLAAPECNDPVASVPGPRITVTDPAGDIRILLVNLLSEPTSLVIPGQEMPFSANNNGPTWNTNLGGNPGPRPDPTARVRSFGREARELGGRMAYHWRNPTVGQPAFPGPLQPGSFAYKSGTHPQVQVQMGLYGAISRDAGANEAYTGVTYAAARDLFFSEVDPALHAEVDAGTFMGSTLEYKPKYFLLQSYDATGNPVDVTIDSANLPPTCINGGLTEGSPILLRMYNMGLRELAPMLIGSHFDLVAEGGKPYPYARTQYQTLLMPGTTKDAVFTPGYAGDFKLIERRLNLTDNMTSGAGMQTCFTVAAAGEPNQPPVLNNPGDQTNTVGDVVNLQIEASDPDVGQTLTYDATPLPAGLTIDTATGLISGTVTTAQPATLVTVTVTDDGTNPGPESVSVDFNWTVNAPNLAPDVTNPGPQTNIQGDVVNLPILATGPEPGDVLTYGATGLPTNLAIDPGTGVISGTVTDLSGDFAVTVTVTDDAVPPLDTSINFTWTIGNRPPVVDPVADQSSPRGFAITPLQIVANDPDTGDTLSYSAINLPAGLTIGTNTGLIEGTVTALPGTFNVEVTVTDSGTPAESVVVSFTWTISIPVYFSTVGNAAVPGVAGPNDDADIYFWNGTTFSRLFDARIGTTGLPGNADIDGLHMVDENTFYVSFTGAVNPPGPLGNMQDEDVLLYDEGEWSLFFDGTANGLGGNPDLDLDAISVVAGVLYFSTFGDAAVPGVAGPYDDSDIYSWNGSNFSRVFDSSALADPLQNNADIDGLFVVDGDTFYMSFRAANNSIEGLPAVQDEDVVLYDAGVWSLIFDGTAQGLNAAGGQDLDAITVR